MEVHMQQYTHEYIKSIPHLPVYCLIYETYRQMSPSHWHDHLEIIYVLEGELQISSNENTDIYANDGHIESRRTFKRLSSEEAKGVKSGYDRDYEYALKYYNYSRHDGDYLIWR